MKDIYNIDNMVYDTELKFNLVYADMIYENHNLSWIDKYWNMLRKDSIFMVQTDDSTMAQVKMKLDEMPNSIFLNTCIMVQEWGGTSKRFFPRKHDYIFIYANGKDYKFYPDRIQIKKKTAGTAFDKKGTGLKTPMDVFYDLGNFSTMSKERVKDNTGHNIRWQKSLSLMNRLMLPTTDENDYILDIFMGSGSLGEWAIKNNRNYVGIEYKKEVFEIARSRLDI
jgi:site-specific DNA-methyltransferase (adenine-specific)